MLLPRFLGRSHATAAAYVAKKTPSIPVRPFHASAALRAIDMAKVDTTQRLADLRKLMKERNVDIYSRRAHDKTCEDMQLTRVSGSFRGQPPERVHCPM
jgi:Xaa-Pro aminopeptidase